MKSIGFRLDDEQHTELEKRGELAGVSVHEISRRLVIKGLEGERDSQALRFELGKISSEVAELRGDLRKVTELLLFAVGKVPLEHAQELVAELLKRAA